MFSGLNKVDLKGSQTKKLISKCERSLYCKLKVDQKMVDLKWGYGKQIKLIANWANMVSYHGPVGKCQKIIPFVIIKKLRDQILCIFEKEH